MSAVVSDSIDDCLRIRLSASDTNVLTTDVLRALSMSLEEAERNARGVMICGGDKFFSNGVDLEWALKQSSAEIRTMFLELGGVS